MFFFHLDAKEKRKRKLFGSNQKIELRNKTKQDKTKKNTLWRPGLRGVCVCVCCFSVLLIYFFNFIHVFFSFIYSGEGNPVFDAHTHRYTDTHK